MADFNVMIQALDPRFEMPAQMTPGASGFDVKALIAESLTLNPGERVLVSCGFAMAMPQGVEAQVRPRSGLAIKHGITVINSPGTIDADYRGEVKVGLVNLGQEAFQIENGMRIAQIVFAKVEHPVFESVTELPETVRGSRGFGSTGTHA